MSEKTVIDEIIDALLGKKTAQQTSELLEQIQKERALFDLFRNAGLSVSADDLQARARLRPEGILSKLEKVDLIDLIETINLIKNIDHIGTIDTITNIANLQSGTITLLDKITQLDRLNPSLREYELNGGFETGDFTNWANTTCSISSVEKHSGSYSAYGVYASGVKQYFPAIQMKEICKCEMWAKGQIGSQLLFRMGREYPSLIAYDYMHTFTSTNWEKLDWYASYKDSIDPLEVFNLIAVGTVAGSGTVYFDDILLQVAFNAVIDYIKEADGRQDLQFKDIDVTFATAGSSEIIPTPASGGLSMNIKVYAYCLRKDNATTVYFLEGASGRKFAKDNAAGIVDMSLFHPIVLAPNNALNLYSSGKCGVMGWLQYKVESMHNVDARQSGQGYP